MLSNVLRGDHPHALSLPPEAQWPRHARHREQGVRIAILLQRRKAQPRYAPDALDRRVFALIDRLAAIRPGGLF